MAWRSAPKTSYLQPVVDPGTSPTAGPFSCVTVATTWLAYMLGGLMQLAQPGAWTTTDATALADLLGRVSDLIDLVGTAWANDLLAGYQPVSNGDPDLCPWMTTDDNQPLIVPV